MRGQFAALDSRLGRVADAPRGQQAPVELLGASQDRLRRFVQLGLGDLLVGLGDLDALADLEQGRERLAGCRACGDRLGNGCRSGAGPDR